MSHTGIIQISIAHIVFTNNSIDANSFDAVYQEQGVNMVVMHSGQSLCLQPPHMRAIARFNATSHSGLLRRYGMTGLGYRS
jgi:hypothetical protein